MSSDPAGVVRELWDRFEARDWDGARALVHDDFTGEWPHSLERFRSGDNYIELQRIYPEGWHIVVHRVVADGDVAVSEVTVTLGDVVDHVASFFEVRDGKVARATEYWVTEGYQEAPAWRAHLVERMR
jgi:ketosteroid isomerase-like protein